MTHEVHTHPNGDRIVWWLSRGHWRVKVMPAHEVADWLRFVGRLEERRAAA